MALEIIPTKTEDSIGIAKSDNVPEGVVLDARHWTTAAQLEQIKDTLIKLAVDVGIDDDPDPLSIKARILSLEDAEGEGADADSIRGVDIAEAAATPTEGDVLVYSGGEWVSQAPAGVESPVIWRWNETDASQFVVALDEIAGGSAVLSVQQAAWGPVLRVAFPTKVTGEKLAVITIADPGLIKDAQHRYRYELRFRLVGFSGTAGQWYSLGPAFLCNKSSGGSFYGLANMAPGNTAGRLARVTAGTVALSGGTPAWQPILLTAGNAGHQTTFENRVVAKHDGAAPGFLNHSLAIKAGASGAAVPLQDAPGSAYFVSQFGAFGSGWSTEVLDTCGIAILGNTGTTADQYFEIDEIQILRHRMDL